MRLLMIGDIVGRPGRRAVKENLPGLVQEQKIDFVIANGENAAGGNGITREITRELFTYGIDVITMGNHVWNKREVINFIENESRLIRPANYPPGTPGKGYGIYNTKNNVKIGVFNLSGRIFMPDLDCPFRSAATILPLLKEECKIILLDFHAEATSEKIALAYYLDNDISAFCGTHTHVQTADERILPGGTAYITDVGMTGPYESVIGVKKELVIEKFLTQMPKRFEVAAGTYQFNAVRIDIDEQTGNALSITRIQNYE
ncbi:TIGR00282 family metallophosphoesterase [Desulfotruncus alcoholivorax]|uniref:TIGR00282 family metallophosphoesterase n=1 Tax=Desulfotruncus alcoholivorax TaxID=265477 RepID=UPI000480BF74|nr:TIGR00282 family metallophosphoesterase [Desulfotruncus alcoholivorax]